MNRTLRWVRAQHAAVRLLVAAVLIALALVAFVATCVLWGTLDWARLLSWGATALVIAVALGVARAQRSTPGADGAA